MIYRLFDFLRSGSPEGQQVDTKDAALFVPLLAASPEPLRNFEALFGLRREIALAKELVGTVDWNAVGAAATSDPTKPTSPPLASDFEAASTVERATILVRELVRLTSTLSSSSSDSFEVLDDPALSKSLCIFAPIAVAACPALLPLASVIPALSRVATGRQLVRSIVANLPACFGESVSLLFGSEPDNRAFSGNCLEDLSGLSPACAARIRDECLGRRSHPGLAVAVTVGLLSDDVEFVSAVCARGVAESAWVRDWMCSPFAGHLAPALRERLLARVMQDGSDALARRTALRAICAAHATLAVPATREELEALLDAAGHAEDSRTLRLFVALVVSCPRLLTLAGRDRVIAFLGRLSSADSLSQLLLLVAILFHTNNLGALHEILCDVVGLPISLQPTAAQQIGELFRKDVFSEEVCCRTAASLPFIRASTLPEIADATFGCVFFLLKNGLFARCRVDVGRWIIGQILACPLPIHPLFPEIIKLFVSSLFSSAQQQQEPGFRFTTLVEATVRSVLGLPRQPLRRFSGIVPLPVSCSPSGSIVARIPQPEEGEEESAASQFSSEYGEAAKYLVTLFVLEHNEQGLLARTELRAQVPQQPHQRAAFFSQFGFPFDLLWEIPIKRLVAGATADPRCSTIVEPMTVLSVSQFPHLFDPSSMLLDPEQDEPAVAIAPPPRSAADLRRLPLPGAGDAVLRDFADAWELEFARDPWELSLSAANSLGCGGRRLEHADLVVDPPLVLRVQDPSVLREPSLVRIVLRVIGCYSMASKKLLLEQLGAQQPKQQDEIATLVAAQDSAIVQALLELCLEEHPALPPPRSEADLASVRRRVCEFVHQRFLESPSLMKLVHFQGYSPLLLPVAVRGIASMWKCVDFIPELLQHREIEKQLFAFELIGHIASCWPVRSSLDVVYEALNRLKAFHENVASPSSLLCRGLPHVAAMCDAFPSIAEEVDDILSGISRCASVHQAVDGNVLSTISETRKRIERHMRDKMAS